MTTITDIRRTALSLVGALCLSTLCITAAVGPARAVERDTSVAQVVVPAIARA